MYTCLLEGPFQAQDLVVRFRCPAKLRRAAAVKEDHQACCVGAHPMKRVEGFFKEAFIVAVLSVVRIVVPVCGAIVLHVHWLLGPPSADKLEKLSGRTCFLEAYRRVVLAARPLLRAECTHNCHLQQHNVVLRLDQESERSPLSLSKCDILGVCRL